MMKKLVIITSLLVAALCNTSNAQVNNGNNVMTQPLWGPVGYDYVEFYYIPDIDIYYNVPGAQYVYLQKKKWVMVKDVPVKHKDFNFYSAHKVVMNEPKPYTNSRANKTKYAQYKGQHDQIAIRESHDQKYMAKEDHPEHSKWISPQDVQDKQNRVNEQNRVTAQNKQDSLNRANQIATENQNRAQEQLNKEQLQKNEDKHKH